MAAVRGIDGVDVKCDVWVELVSEFIRHLSGQVEIFIQGPILFGRYVGCALLDPQTFEWRGFVPKTLL